MVASGAYSETRPSTSRRAQASSKADAISRGVSALDSRLVLVCCDMVPPNPPWLEVRAATLRFLRWYPRTLPACSAQRRASWDGVRERAATSDAEVIAIASGRTCADTHHPRLGRV